MSSTIHQEILIKANPQQIYDALTQTDQFSKVTGGTPTDISSEEGGSFTCFGGYVSGRHIELVPGLRIVQAWRGRDWNEGTYSIAKFDFQQQGDETLLIFDHVGFPEEHQEHLATGWYQNYWEPLEKYFA